MEMVTGWTGASACALQAALRLSNKSFAAHLGIGVRTVATWHQKPTLRPRPEMQQLLDTALVQASQAVKDLFAALAGKPSVAPDSAIPADTTTSDSATAAAEYRLATDQNIGLALNRLDQLGGWEPGTARSQVAARLVRLDRRELLDRASRRGSVGQQRFARALRDYYRGQVSGYGQYDARSRDLEVMTAVLTHPGWLDLECPLATGYDRLALASVADARDAFLSADAADAAAQRLAESLAADTRFMEAPLYRLADIDIAKGKIGGSLALARFTSYALTLDLLEGELADSLAAGAAVRPGSLPLRDRYLPDLASVLDVGGRLCAGGVAAVCAFARPPGPYRGQADYVLLVQERSAKVINAAGRLAVIPKGFHQPMTDFHNDARIAVTLLREMEEELFGRDDIDNTMADQHVADPLHPARLSGPMRWLLMENPGALRMECTGFGLNLVSGNYEFACLIVVDSEDFWTRYGGQVEANWESLSLRQYSSLDGDSLAALACDDRWSDEGLFALVQGLRRLRQAGGNRVGIPAIEWGIHS
jgi:hypothetical protein